MSTDLIKWREMARTAEPLKWTKEMTMSLINIYKGYECLWNRNSTNYRNRAMKTAAVLDISIQLGVHVEEILRKLHNLRCQLNSEIRKVVRKRKEGICYTSAWDLFDPLLFMSDVKIPNVAHVNPTISRSQQANEIYYSTGRIPTQRPYQVAVVKTDVLDDLIEVKYEIDDNHALYPFIQIDDDSSQSPEEIQEDAQHSNPEPSSAINEEPPQKRPKKDNPEDEVQIVANDVVECLTPNVYVDNPMADDGEDDARTFGDFVAAELSRIRSDGRRESLKRTIEEAIKAIVEEDENEFFQDPDKDPLS